MEERTNGTREPAISVRDLKKSFRIYGDKSPLLKDRILFWKRNRYHTHEVLRGLSFDVAQGEAVGLIGRNGCGKSTTLKMLTRIMYPNEGSIRMRGRVSALIELGAGFHPDMSGRENIYTNAAIFGLSRREVNERMDRIIAFSELGGFIDNPVRTYSSGMYMRLAFSVAINVDADILLVDEILAVGDAAFQAKCINKLREIKASGTTIVIVSHDLSQIENLCDRSIWIKDGTIAMQGKPEQVHAAYLAYMNPAPSTQAGDAAQRRREDLQDRAASFDSVTVLNSHDEPCRTFKRGEEIRIRADYTVREPDLDPVCGIGIFRTDNFFCYGTNTMTDGVFIGKRQGRQSFVFRIDACPFMRGDYLLNVSLSRTLGDDLDVYFDAARFSVTADAEDEGNVYTPHGWSFSAAEAEETEQERMDG